MSSTTQDGLRILVVDDDTNMARTVADILSVKGYRVRTAHSASEAVEHVDSQTFDCVLSDIRMPETNGIDLFHVVHARQPQLPFLLMTAYSADSLIREGIQAGAAGVLTKPLDIEKLLALFSALCQQSAHA